MDLRISLDDVTKAKPILKASIPLMPFTIVLPQKQEGRLNTTCFRGRGKPLSGNFHLWESLKNLLADTLVREQLFGEILEMITELKAEGKQNPNHRITIDHTHLIGWSSTCPISELPEGTEVAFFAPNDYTEAYKVTDKAVLAKPTKQITFALGFSDPEGKDKWLVKVQTIYPGENVPMGWRHSPRSIPATEAVFFDWTHPGEPIVK
ncbi:MAG: hypothetical protein NTX72_06225 [Candidatus Uhrbacteria bacterium]|nr:hypothetical protein [Candidatus Uhrbacteria bacterium]